MARNKATDTAKGLLIIGVVLQHVLIKTLPNTFHLLPIYNFLVSYDMSLFMLMSGYLAYSSLDKCKNLSRWLCRKVLYFLPAHFIFNALLYWVSKLNITVWGDLSNKYTYIEWLNESFVYDQGEWFLWVLCILFMFLAVVKWLKGKVQPKTYLLMLAIMSILIIIVPIDGQLFKLYRIQYYLPFVLGGYLLSEYKDILISKISVLSAVELACVYLVVLWKSNWNGGWGSTPYANLISNFSWTSLRYLQAITIIPFICLVSYVVSNYETPLIWLGQNTLCIYLTSLIFTNVGFGSDIVLVVTGFLGSLLISSIVAFEVRKVADVFKV